MSPIPPELSDTLIAGKDITFIVNVIKGLLANEKNIPSYYLYRGKGTDLYTTITTLDEYYLTRRDLSTMSDVAKQIFEHTNDAVEILELGPGNGDKIKLILDNLKSLGAKMDNITYSPMDVSVTYLNEVSELINNTHPDVTVCPKEGNFTNEIPCQKNMKTILLFLGSSIGNLNEAEATHFFRNTSRVLKPADVVIVGMDRAPCESINKSIEDTVLAYFDSQGVTSEFNYNLIDEINVACKTTVLSREDFKHEVVYNTTDEAMESYLVSKRKHAVNFPGDTLIEFHEGERIFVERSMKYSIQKILRYPQSAGLKITATVNSSDKWFTNVVCEVPKKCSMVEISNNIYDDFDNDGWLEATKDAYCGLHSIWCETVTQLNKPIVSALEIGFGTGEFPEQLLKQQWISDLKNCKIELDVVDPALLPLSKAAEMLCDNDVIKYKNGFMLPFEDFTMPDGSYDLIQGLYSWSCFPRDRLHDVCLRTYNLLSENGRAMVFQPTKCSFYNYFYELYLSTGADGTAYVSAHEIIAALEEMDIPHSVRILKHDCVVTQQQLASLLSQDCFCNKPLSYWMTLKPIAEYIERMKLPCGKYSFPNETALITIQKRDQLDGGGDIPKVLRTFNNFQKQKGGQELNELTLTKLRRMFYNIDSDSNVKEVENAYDDVSELYDEFMNYMGWSLPSQIIRTLENHISGSPLVLDVGCGTGLLGSEIQKRNLISLNALHGIDISPQNIKTIEEKSRHSIYQTLHTSDICGMPIADSTFDICISCGVLGIAPAASLSEMQRVTKSGGLLIFSLWGGARDAPYYRKIRKMLDEGKLSFVEKKRVPGFENGAQGKWYYDVWILKNE